ERVKQRRLCALAQLEREHVGPIQHSCPLSLERTHERERQWDRAGVAADIRARAGLIEIESGTRWIGIAERRLLQVERRVGDASPLECREQGLLPLRVFMQDDQIDGHLLLS